ncbi:Glycoside hydrolase, catalytic domain-containing protein [Cynara cardunculus var. scolymus]|uniref:Glycoside hydrolase, catalytic domain-containing protein n=1 Tax=Cynara cardunculus var. scolymus TaxID=59895 RepID=A0A103XI35_CYNCS|nr:Glycoside hydrolase, catalytic domain-containing protein [Cynara cardunculus var. scolymus]
MGEETKTELDLGTIVVDDDVKRQNFPDNFLFGVGTSAHQVEGAWNVDGKGLSIWDCFALRNPDKISGGANACVTVASYSRMKEDVQLLKKMGVNSYRFSISWPRILPGGKVSMGKNQEGINYYNRLIDELLANGIEPFVTLFHWDLPNALEEEYMGFLSSKVVADFVDYVDICFWEFGDRVKHWLTVNEPHMFTYNGYVTGTFAPGRGANCKDSDLETEPYTVAYNLLNCHAAAYRKYEKDYKSFQKGKVGITLDLNFSKPYRGPSNVEDVKAVEYASDFVNGWFLEPLTKGAWPENMQKFATTPTANYPKGRTLPEFSEEQRIKLIDSYDFLGINYYTAFFVQYQAPSASIPPGYTRDCHFVASGSPDMNDTAKTYQEVRDDTYRMEYIRKHLIAIRTAIRNNVDVMGYYVWSFMDSFEWSSGYKDRFGLIYVDYVNDLQRYPKNSALWYKKFLSEKKVVLLKRARVDDEKEDEATDMVSEPEKPSEVVPKLKKAKA